MDAENFEKLMKERHSVRYFQKKEIPQETLKKIISLALNSPSWCNSQAWNIYVASGKTLSEIRNIWISKNKEKIKGYSDYSPGHRTDASERSQKTMGKFFKDVGEFTKEEDLHTLNDCQAFLYNAPTIVYLTLPKGVTKFSIVDIGALEMSILLAAKAYGVDSLIAYESIKYPDVLRKFCNIPDNEDIVIGIPLGYGDDNLLNKFRAKKLSVEEACHFYN